MGLQRFEAGLERLVEGTLPRPFRSNLQPVEIGRRLTREMDLHRRLGVQNLVAPNIFTVTLAPGDYERFSGFLDALSRELADAAREHARIEGYAFLGPIDVVLQEGNRLRPGRFSITAESKEGVESSGKGEIVLPDRRRFQVGTEPLVVGRLPECEVVLSDPNVSRRHVQFRRVSGSYIVSDLGSTNGTKVNGVPVQEHVLGHLDQVTVGSTIISFENL